MRVQAKGRLKYKQLQMAHIVSHYRNSPIKINEQQRKVKSQEIQIVKRRKTI